MMSDLARTQAAQHASRPGVRTTEFRGKLGVQVLLMVVIVLQQFGLDVSLDQQTAIVIIAGLEGAYTLGRSIVKGAAVKQPPPAQNVSVTQAPIDAKGRDVTVTPSKGE